MSGTTTTTPAAGAKGGSDNVTPKFKGGPGKEGNPAKAGWFAKIVLTIICVLWLVPLVGLLITSFRGEQEANTTGWWSVFANPGNFGFVGLDNYQLSFERADLDNAFINSVAIALPATFIPLLVAAFAAYAFSFMRFPGRDALFLTVVALLVIPNYVAFVPILDLYNSTGMSGTFPAVWLFHIGFGMPLAVYILRNYMSTLPLSVIESAKIDGASHFQTFWRLILPMSVPALASFAIFQFLWVWNDLFVALVLIGPGDNAPVTVAIQNSLLSQQGEGWNLVTAGGFFSMVVPIIVFLSMQRFFVRGLTAGAVKG
ncbi:MAG TPA: carbohydrate ABC transporter permease [Nocardioides sp.]|nr:carbohydrate ABC transporter permease [Nocardioides sp.]